MGEICGLKFHFSHMHTSQKKIIEILPPVRKEGDFFTEFCNFAKFRKCSSENEVITFYSQHGGIFSRPLFIIIFRSKMVEFHPDSILS